MNVPYKNCHHKCTENLNKLISNINNKSFKKICANIADHVINITDKKVADLYACLEKNNECIRHFLLHSITDINNELLKTNAGFVFGVSDELNNYFQKKIHDHIDFTISTSAQENVYKNVLYINSLIKKHTLDDKLLFKLTKPNTNLHVFYLGIMS